jgi:hypothetical protein
VKAIALLTVVAALAALALVTPARPDAPGLSSAQAAYDASRTACRHASASVLWRSYGPRSAHVVPTRHDVIAAYARALYPRGTAEFSAAIRGCSGTLHE